MKVISNQQDNRQDPRWFGSATIVLLVVIFSTMATIASAQFCANYESATRWVGGVEAPGMSYGSISVDFPNAYFISGNGLWVFDVSDPTNPTSQQVSPIPGRKFWKNGEIALMDQLADDSVWPHLRKIQVFDCSDPLNPFPGDSLIVGPFIMDVDYFGDFALVAAEGSGLLFLDVSDPNNLEVLHTWNQGTKVFSVDIDDELAYVGTSKGVHIFNLANLPQADVVGYIDGYHPLVTQDGEYLVTSSGNEFRLFDLQDPETPVFVDYIEGAPWDSYPQLENGILTAHGQNGTSVWSLKNPGVSRESSRLAGGPWWWSSDLNGGMLYVASSSGLNIFDLGSGVPIMPEATISQVYLIEDAEYRDGHSFLATSDSGMRVFDMTTLEEIEQDISESEMREIELSGDLAVLAGHGEFAVVDISNPESTEVLSHLFNLPMGPLDMELQGSQAWVLTHPGEEALVFDFTDPNQPEQLTSIDLPPNTKDIEFDNDLLYMVGESENYLKILNPADNPPSLVSIFDLGDNGVSVSVDNGLAVVCFEFGDISLVDVSIPTHPELMSQLTSWESGKAVLKDGKLSVSNRHGLQLFDVSAMGSPERVGEFWFQNTGHHLLPNGDYLMWHKLSGRFVVAPGPCESSLMVAKPTNSRSNLLEIGPNPFNPSTTLEFTLPQPGYCRLVIHDLRGYEVKTLCSEELSEGNQRFVWKGIDASGRAVPSGLYIARLEHGGGVDTRKLALVK